MEVLQEILVNNNLSIALEVLTHMAAKGDFRHTPMSILNMLEV
jgi:hypothetical protein